jgi:hypothetical protein
MMKINKIYRRKMIPDEYTLLKDDIIVFQDDTILVTKWDTIRHKTAFSHGSSCYFLNEGFKVSKFYREDNSLLAWYCDIAEYKLDFEENSLTMTDLLADVVVYPDGGIKIMDLDELADAMEQNLITSHQMTACLRSLNRLLSIIYQNQFGTLQEKLNQLGL